MNAVEETTSAKKCEDDLRNSNSERKSGLVGASLNMGFFRRKTKRKSKTPKRLIEERDLAMIREARKLELERERRGKAGRFLSD